MHGTGSQDSCGCSGALEAPRQNELDLVQSTGVVEERHVASSFCRRLDAKPRLAWRLPQPLPRMAWC